MGRKVSWWKVAGKTGKGLLFGALGAAGVLVPQLIREGITDPKVLGWAALAAAAAGVASGGQNYLKHA